MLYDSRQTRKTKIFKVFTCSGVFSLPLHNWFENMPGQKILASTIAMTFRDEIKNKLGALESDQTPLLVGILANNDPAAKASPSGLVAPAKQITFAMSFVLLTTPCWSKLS